ncbi:MAG: antitoxin VapB family protein [Longimicrobiales bacterium]|nr:antitoxin VapB family protein [Longimicrobiales bacterium]
MATKTISVDLEAYERLRRARRSPDESFSRVIKRATWESPPRTAAYFLEALRATPLVDEETLDRLDAAQGEDTPPEDPWHAR